MDWDTLLNSIATGFSVGIGSTLGTYLVTKHFIKNLERIEERFKNGNGKKG